MIWVIAVILFSISILETMSVVTVANKIGILPTILCMFFSVVLGIYLIRMAGLTTIQRISTEIQAGQLPGQALLDGVSFFLAGVMLLLPGFCTDIVALLLLIPFTRIWIQRFLIFMVFKRMRR